jgi:NarL family two-component system response regulator LiaR
MASGCNTGVQAMPESQKIRVLIADDHEMVRMGLTIYLEVHDDLVIVGEAANGQQAIRLCDELQPDVVLMDVQMPVMDGLTATAVITQKHPEIGVVILTSSLPRDREQEAYQVGAQAVLQKNTSSERIRESILSAVR